MTLHFDVIVIGSGPAGSAAATVAARGGLRVALLDKAAFPRDKLCGGAITGRAARFMADIFGQPVTSDMFLTSRRFRLAWFGKPLGVIENAPPIHLGLRRRFDAMLQSHAIAVGAQVFAPVRLTTIDPKAGIVTLADGRMLQAPVVVGADGVNSAVARALYGRAYEPGQVAFALEIEAPRPDRSDRTVEIDLGAAEWGYGWVFPKKRSLTIGVGGLHTENPDMKARMQAYLALHCPADQVTELLTGCKGAFIPGGLRRDPPGGGRALLTGDAAGLVDPMTGEGIGWAMRSGQLAAEAALAAFAESRPERALEHYTRLLKPVQFEIDRAHRLHRIIYAKPMRAAAARFIASNQGLQRAYLKLLAGERDYKDLSPGSIVRLAGRITRSMLSRTR